ncbi:MAG: DUF4160 domain-containing protein [Actinomycetota bacterium]|nr:DUF4160 domain-containing protein [Actinomycetota bacterium]
MDRKGRGRPRLRPDLRYADQEAALAIETLEVLAGSLPGRAMRLVEEWAKLHREELDENWRRAWRRIGPQCRRDDTPHVSCCLARPMASRARSGERCRAVSLRRSRYAWPGQRGTACLRAPLPLARLRKQASREGRPRRRSPSPDRAHARARHDDS